MKKIKLLFCLGIVSLMLYCVDPAHPHAENIPNTIGRLFKLVYRFLADHSAISNQTKIADLKSPFHPFGDRDDGFYVCGIARPHFTTKGFTFVVEHCADDHLV